MTVGLSNGLRMRRNLAGGLPITQQHRTPSVIPFWEHFYATHETRFERCNRSVWECRNTKRTTGQRTGCKFWKHEDAMQMMTWQNATRRHMTWQGQRITGRHLAHRTRGVTFTYHFLFFLREATNGTYAPRVFFLIYLPCDILFLCIFIQIY